MLPDSSMPDEISQSLRRVGTMWAASPVRPRIGSDTKKHWDALVEQWAASDLPFIVRRSGPRGDPIRHASGRTVILADNSPSQWAFTKAYDGAEFSLDDIRGILATGRMPFAMVLKGEAKQKSAFKCNLDRLDAVNTYGWKLCHIDHVGLKSRVPTAELPLERLIRHFGLLLRPSNHFLVPLAWSGLGEVPEVIAEIAQFESAQDLTSPKSATL
jgi:hypothetical protein